MKKNDFHEFMKSEAEPSLEAENLIKTEIARDLYWLPSLTFIKTLAAHWLAGLITLSFCPQFGWNPFNTSVHLPHIFMKYGMWACGLFCGSAFMALGASATFVVLTSNERVYLARRDWLFAASLSALSMGALMILAQGASGADVFFTESFIAFWVIGAFVFDFATLKGWFSRYRSRMASV